MQDSECCVILTLQSLPPFLVPEWVISRYSEHQQCQIKWVDAYEPVDAEGLWNSSLMLRHHLPKEWANIWRADHGVEHRAEIYVIDLYMNQLYNRHGSWETWLTVPAVQWRTLLSLLKYIYVCWMEKIFWSYHRQAHSCQEGHRTSCYYSRMETWILNQSVWRIYTVHNMFLSLPFYKEISV